MQKTIQTIFIAIFLIGIVSCAKTEVKKSLKTGFWNGTIQMQQKTLPFNFEILKNNDIYTIHLINGEETLILDEIRVKKDSLFFTFHIFDIDVKAKIKDSIIEGVYIKNYFPDYNLPFKAHFGKKLFKNSKNFNSNITEKWDMTFYGENNLDTTKAVGIFNLKDSKLSGTVLTPIGDYRYLDGFINQNDFTLNSFDGNHAFIFDGEMESDSVLNGTFYSGKTFKENFSAVKNNAIELKNANELTYLKEGYEKLAFSFPDLGGNLVTLDDEKYQNKVVIVQVFGTWCPNCMDESKFYQQWFLKNSHRDVEIIGLAYEAKDDFNYAKNRVEKMKNKLEITYDFLIAGTSNKTEAAKTLPMLNHIMSFPTSIFIDKKGTIRKIHTGFSGPATGKYYDEYIQEFTIFMETLLLEKY